MGKNEEGEWKIFILGMGGMDPEGHYDYAWLYHCFYAGLLNHSTEITYVGVIR